MSNKRIEYIKKNNAELSSEIVNVLADADPTNEKKYLVWLVRMYKNQNLKLTQEQLSSVSLLLLSFNENKNKIPQEKRDLNKFNTLLELATFLMSFERENRKSEESFLRNGTRKVYEDENWLVASPLTIDSSIKLGKGTTWCTSSKEHSNNYFHSYSGKGELFIVINKKLGDRALLKKRQLHFDYNGYNFECRNSRNIEIDVIKFFKENKEVFNAMSSYESIINAIKVQAKFFILIENPTEEQIITAIDSNKNNFKYVKEVTEKIEEAYLSHFYKEDDYDYSLIDKMSNFSKAFKSLEKLNIKLQLIGVSINPNLISYIQEKKEKVSVKVQVRAVEIKSSIIKKINNPCKEAIEEALEEMPQLISEIKNPTNEQQVSVVYKKPNLILKIKNPCKEAMVAAVKGKKIFYNDYKESFNNQDIISILQDVPEVIKYIDSPIEEFQYEAIKADFEVFKFIKNPTKKVKSLHTRKKNKEKKISDELALERKRIKKKMLELEKRALDSDGYNRGRDKWDSLNSYDSYDNYGYASDHRRGLEEEMYKILKDYIIKYK